MGNKKRESGLLENTSKGWVSRAKLTVKLIRGMLEFWAIHSYYKLSTINYPILPCYPNLFRSPDIPGMANLPINSISPSNPDHSSNPDLPSKPNIPTYPDLPCNPDYWS